MKFSLHFGVSLARAHEIARRLGPTNVCVRRFRDCSYLYLDNNQHLPFTPFDSLGVLDSSLHKTRQFLFTCPKQQTLFVECSYFISSHRWYQLEAKRCVLLLNNCLKQPDLASSSNSGATQWARKQSLYLHAKSALQFPDELKTISTCLVQKQDVRVITYISEHIRRRCTKLQYSLNTKHRNKSIATVGRRINTATWRIEINFKKLPRTTCLYPLDFIVVLSGLTSLKICFRWHYKYCIQEQIRIYRLNIQDDIFYSF